MDILEAIERKNKLFGKGLTSVQRDQRLKEELGGAEVVGCGIINDVTKDRKDIVVSVNVDTGTFYGPNDCLPNRRKFLPAIFFRIPESAANARSLLGLSRDQWVYFKAKIEDDGYWSNDEHLKDSRLNSAEIVPLNDPPPMKRSILSWGNCLIFITILGIAVIMWIIIQQS